MQSTLNIVIDISRKVYEHNYAYLSTVILVHGILPNNL